MEKTVKSQQFVASFQLRKMERSCVVYRSVYADGRGTGDVKTILHVTIPTATTRKKIKRQWKLTEVLGYVERK